MSSSSTAAPAMLHCHRHDYDVVIVGGGTAGAAAAALLGDAEKRVLLLEKEGQLGGILDGLLRTPGLWAPQALSDVNDLEKYFKRYTEAGAEASEFSKAELETFFKDSKAVLEKLVDMGALPPLVKDNREHPAYHGDQTNTMFASNVDDGPCSFYRNFAKLLEFGLKLLNQQLATIVPQTASGQLLAPGFVYRLTSYVESLRSVEVKLHQTCTGLARQENAWAVTTAKGDVFTAPHVIFASGGFTANAELMQARGYGDIVSNVQNRRNNGVLEWVAKSVGARASPPRDPCWYAEAVAHEEDSTTATRQVVLFLSGDSMMVVNRSGRRVYNEKDPYAIRGAVNRREGGLLLIGDARSVKHQALSVGSDPKNCYYMPPAGLKTWIRAGSVGELVEKLKAKGLVHEDFADEFPAQLQRFNGFARAGKDPEFGRGSDPAKDRSFQPDEPEDFMYPIDETDLYACLLLPSSLDTCSGPAVDEHNRLIRDATGDSMKGLYAIGNCAESLTHGFYLCAGVPTLSGIIGAWRAAQCILK